MAEARKTTMGHITTEHLKQSLIALPCETLVEKYTETTKSIYAEIIQRKEENQQLTTLRDWLLPMLMNGQVSVE